MHACASAYMNSWGGGKLQTTEWKLLGYKFRINPQKQEQTSLMCPEKRNCQLGTQFYPSCEENTRR